MTVEQSVGSGQSFTQSRPEDGWTIGDRWGVSDDEVSQSYPCDSLVVSPELQAWRGVRVEAPSEVVRPWVAQVRLAPYSYDWIANLGRRSPRELVGLPEPEVGEPLTTAGGRKLGGRPLVVRLHGECGRC